MRFSSFGSLYLPGGNEMYVVLLLALVFVFVPVYIPILHVCLLCHAHQGIKGYLCPFLFVSVRPRSDEVMAQAAQNEGGQEDNDGCQEESEGDQEVGLFVEWD